MEAVKAQLTLHKERDEHAAGDTRRRAGTLMNEYPLVPEKLRSAIFR